MSGEGIQAAIRRAFDSNDVAFKNIMLRQAYDALQEARRSALLEAAEIVRKEHSWRTEREVTGVLEDVEGAIRTLAAKGQANGSGPANSA